MRNKRLSRTEKAAIKWWLTYRPFGWTVSDHLLYPTVNLNYPLTKKLAIEVARLIKRRGRI